MTKQLEFTEFEQSVVTELLKNIGTILIQKMDEGVDAPELSGVINIKGENRVVTFEIIAKSK